MEIAKSYNAEGMKKLEGFLKPEQLKRFKQVEVQADGRQRLHANPDVAKALKVTDEQKEKVTALIDRPARAQMTEARDAARRRPPGHDGRRPRPSARRPSPRPSPS